MNRVFWIVFLVLLLAPVILALSPCHGTSWSTTGEQQNNEWAITSIRKSSLGNPEVYMKFDNACGICHGGTCAGNSNSFLVASDSMDNRTLKFYYLTEKADNGTEPSDYVHIVDVTILDHVDNTVALGIGGTDEWPVSISFPFLGPDNRKIVPRIREGEDWSFDLSKMGGNVGIYPLGRAEAKFDYDYWWWAQADRFDLALNRKALELLEDVYDTPLDEWKALSGPGFQIDDYNAIFLKMGKIKTVDEVKERAKQRAKIFNPSNPALAEQAAAAGRVPATALIAPLGLTGQGLKGGDILRVDLSNVDDATKKGLTANFSAKDPSFSKAPYNGDPIVYLLNKVDPKITATRTKAGGSPENWPAKWEGNKIRFDGLSAGDTLTVSFKLRGYDGDVSFEVYDITALEDR